MPEHPESELTDNVAASLCRVWLDGSRDAPFNMAADEWLLHCAEDTGTAYLRTYGWTERAVTIGYFQPHTIGPAGYRVVRRPTGGGLVYHVHDFTFTIAVPRAHRLFRVDRFASYRLVNEAVRQAVMPLGIGVSLAARASDVPDRHALQCFVTPARFDVMTPEGKLCGGAQRRTRRGMLVQNSIDLERLPTGGAERLRDLLVPALSTLLGPSSEPWTPTDAQLADVRQLADSRYATNAWNQRK